MALALWRPPSVFACVSASSVTLRLDDAMFECRPLVAVEELGEKLIIRAIGDDAQTKAGDAGFRVVNPFASSEPFLSDLDYAVAVFAHGLRELLGRRTLRAPSIVLRLTERFSPLSETELELASSFASLIGARNVFVFLGDAIPPIGRQGLRQACRHAIKPANDKR